MRRLTVSLLTMFMVLLSYAGYGQSKLTGQVVDEGDKTKLKNATIMLLQAKDSILVDFTRADDEGRFTLGKSDTMDYLMVVSYPKFGDYVQSISKDLKGDMGEIGLTSVAHLIEEVMITGKIPVVIKGDTIEYDAGSFTVEKNAKVEDLLKVLPGMTVDADGKITAQGKTVEKVLVDGEEFFGDDPTLVTRNIRSDMVDKVQVYEKRSDEAERTGVDDGQRIQTINVKLKEDAKNGMFGKLEGGVGNDEFYTGRFAVNKFKGSQKIGAYGIASNDGNFSLSWEDEEKFGIGSENVEMTEDGGMIFYGGGDEFSYWNGQGRPQAINTGISFMDRWKEGKQKLNMSYKYGRIENNEVSTTESQQNLLENTYNQSLFSNRYSENQRHRFNGRYDWNIDSLTTFTMKLSGSRGQREGNDMNEATTMEEGVMVNENERTQSSTGTTSNVSYDGMVTKKFKKQGRSLSVRLAGNISENNGDGLLRSETNIYNKNGVLTEEVLIDQMKDNNSTSNNLQTSITYTEPFSEKWKGSLGYGYNNSKSHSVNNSFNNNGNDVYDVFDEEFSNDFDFNTVRNYVNLTLGYKIEKIDFNLTNNVRNDDMYQRNNYLSTDVQRGFLTYNPSVRFRYNITKSKSINLSYNRNNNLPTLSQIQPLRQNTDPLNIVVGNESLTPARSNNYNMYYNSYDMLKNKYIYGSLGFTQTHNSIQQNVTIGDGGIRTILYDNIKDHVNNSGYLWAGMGSNVIKKYSIQGRYGVNADINSSYNFLNNELNKNLSYSYGLSLGVEKNTTKNVDFRWNVNPGWRRLESSLQPQFNSSGFTMGSDLNFKVFLPAKFQLYGNGRYTYEAPTEVFNEKFERLIFTPGVSKRFLKNESLQVDVYVNDVFNKNIGFRRSQSAGIIRQENYNTISRFFMFKVSWDFTSMKVPD